MHNREVKYYDLTKNWSKVRRHLNDKELNDILVLDFNKFTYGTWRQKFIHGQYPTDFETCDWQCERKGRIPAYWKYTKHAACHWLVNFTLKLAMLVMPNQPWRIITSAKHSTVWNGGDLIFDFNFQAFGISPSECFEDAFEGEQLAVGEYLKCYMAEHWKRIRKAPIQETIRTKPELSNPTSIEFLPLGF
jgi:hypothetical protein